MSAIVRKREHSGEDLPRAVVPKQSSTRSISDLSTELLMMVFELCSSPRDIIELELTCRRFKKIIKDNAKFYDNIWKRFLRNTYPECLEKPRMGLSFKDLFKIQTLFYHALVSGNFRIQKMRYDFPVLQVGEEGETYHLSGENRVFCQPLNGERVFFEGKTNPQFKKFFKTDDSYIRFSQNEVIFYDLQGVTKNGFSLRERCADAVLHEDVLYLLYERERLDTGRPELCQYDCQSGEFSDHCISFLDDEEDPDDFSSHFRDHPFTKMFLDGESLVFTSESYASIFDLEYFAEETRIFTERRLGTEAFEFCRSKNLFINLNKQEGTISVYDSPEGLEEADHCFQKVEVSDEMRDAKMFAIRDSLLVLSGGTEDTQSELSLIDLKVLNSERSFQQFKHSQSVIKVIPLPRFEEEDRQSIKFSRDLKELHLVCGKEHLRIGV